MAFSFTRLTQEARIEPSETMVEAENYEKDHQEEQEKSDQVLSYLDHVLANEDHDEKATEQCGDEVDRDRKDSFRKKDSGYGSQGHLKLEVSTYFLGMFITLLVMCPKKFVRLKKNCSFVIIFSKRLCHLSKACYVKWFQETSFFVVNFLPNSLFAKKLVPFAKKN